MNLYTCTIALDPNNVKCEIHTLQLHSLSSYAEKRTSKAT